MDGAGVGLPEEGATLHRSHSWMPFTTLAYVVMILSALCCLSPHPPTLGLQIPWFPMVEDL